MKQKQSCVISEEVWFTLQLEAEGKSWLLIKNSTGSRVHP